MSSRFKFTNNDGSLNQEMSRTSSMMMMSITELNKEADEMEKQVESLEEKRDNLNRMQRRMESGALLEQMKDITEAADPSTTVMLQGFNWESWQAGRGDWYGILADKVNMCADMGITDIWLPPPTQSVAP